MPHFSQRLSHRRVSRAVVTTVLITTVIGSAYEFHRTHKSQAAPPPAAMSVSTSAGSAGTLRPVMQAEPIQPTKPVITTLVTETPGQKTKAIANELMPVSSVISTDRSKPVSLTQPPSVLPLASSAASSASSQISSSTLLSDAAAKTAAGDLVGAREMLNSALVTGKLSAADADSVKKQLSDLNQTLVFSARQFPKDPLGGIYIVKSGDRLAAIGAAHEIPYELLLQLNRMTDAKKLRYGQTLKIINGPFHVVVSKSKFSMDVYLGAPGGENSAYITSYPVGLGTDNSTPTGTWCIKNKVTHPTYFPPEGHAGPVLDPNDPKNPLGAYWMGLEGTDGQAVGQRSYGIHGTIDPGSIGKQSSMGCIRMKNEDVEQVYKMLVPGKSIVVVKD